MKGTLTGRCICGEVTYTIKEGFRLGPYACHCTDCQKRTGSAFSEHLLFAEADMEITGNLNVGLVKQPSGAMSRISGCSKCMSRIYAKNDKREGFASLRCGSLDNSTELVPKAHIWVKSKQPWIELPNSVPHMEMAPDDTAGWIALLADRK